jgi:LuxR family quorum-sensing system transcriptional regulator CciR
MPCASFSSACSQSNNKPKKSELNIIADVKDQWPNSGTGGEKGTESLGVQSLRYALAILETATLPALTLELEAAIAPLEITAAASGFVSGPRAVSPMPFQLTTWPQAWIDIYMANEFLLDDPLPRWARSSGQAISFSALSQILPPRDPGRRVIEAAAAFGYHEGMAIPMRAVDGALGLIAFATPRLVLSAAEQFYLTVIGRATFEAAERIERAGEPGRVAPIMTDREINCMALLVQGHSDRQIGEILGVSAPTVRFHLGNARSKSGAVSRTHLAALAVALGYVAIQE